VLAKTDPATGDRGARQKEHFGRNVVSAENNHSAKATQAPSGPPDTKLVPKSSVRHVSVAEESDFYSSLARLNKNWRVIRCRHSIQWILQVRCGPGWRNRFFFRTRAGLIQFAREYTSPIGGDALIILLRLPERFPEGASTPGSDPLNIPREHLR
jgi:hypothetical protein